MTVAIVIYGLLAAMFLLDALRIRGRVRSLRVMPPSEDAPSSDHVFLVAPGVVLSEEIKRAASAYARAEKLDVLDLVPGTMSALALWNFAYIADLDGYRQNRIAPGITAVHATLVSKDVLARAGVDVASVSTDRIAFLRVARKLKRYAATSSDLAIAKDLVAQSHDPYRDRAVLSEIMGGMEKTVTWGLPVVLGVAYSGLYFAPIAGPIAAVFLHLQHPIALAGAPVKARGLASSFLFRPFVELVAWLKLLGTKPVEVREQHVEEKRAVYDALIAQGTERFFNPRREDCPICAGKNLVVHLKTGDLLQCKPGTFILERCKDCSHVFQNPQLSIEGLDFYYKDFYDGLGERALDDIFGWSGQPYVNRAEMVKTVATPTKWLDVGCGHGHFANVARDVFPNARFEGLDLSESVEEAERRRWIDKAYRGLFPEVAPTLAGQYDVVSMSHYLEHTLDPRSEIKAAATALSDGGLLMIEVPDPDSPFGKLFGRLWLPWFQPQHLNLVSTKNLERLFHEHGFEVVLWHRAEAHQRVDLVFATYLFFRWLAPSIDVPWRPKPGLVRSTYHRFVWLSAVLPIAFARIGDRLLSPLQQRLGGSNTYRVIARKGAAKSERDPATQANAA